MTPHLSHCLRPGGPTRRSPDREVGEYVKLQGFNEARRAGTTLYSILKSGRPLITAISGTPKASPNKAQSRDSSTPWSSFATTSANSEGVAEAKPETPVPTHALCRRILSRISLPSLCDLRDLRAFALKREPSAPPAAMACRARPRCLTIGPHICTNDYIPSNIP
jgi:hypothetical protein